MSACARCGAPFENHRRATTSLHDKVTLICNGCKVTEILEASNLTQPYIGEMYWQPKERKPADEMPDNDVRFGTGPDY